MSENLVWMAVAVICALWLWSRMRGRVAPDVAKRLVKEGALLVDVRSPEEFSSGSVKGATNIPVSEVESRIKEFGDPKGSIVLFCASGMRSASAKAQLEKAGYTDVHNLGAMHRYPR